MKDASTGYGFSDDPDARPARPPAKKAKAAKPDRTSQPLRAAQKEVSGAVVYAKTAALLLPLVGLAVFMAFRQNTTERAEEEAFAADMVRLTAPPTDGSPPAPPTGRVAVVEVDAKVLHHTHRNLWPSIRAATPAEAAVVVQLKERREAIATYTNGSRGIRISYDVTVIDIQTNRVLGRKTFPGSDPPLVTVGKMSADAGDTLGSRPDPSMLSDYYKSLLAGG